VVRDWPAVSGVQPAVFRIATSTSFATLAGIHEVCGTATCARLRVDVKVDPRVLTDNAVALVKSHFAAVGRDPSKVSVRRASYGMSGAMLVEPATMLSHGASLAEVGTVTVAGPAQEELTVELKGTTELAYDDEPPPVATQPPPQTRPVVAAE